MRITPPAEVRVPSFQCSFLAGGFVHSLEIITLGHLLDRVRVEQEIHANLKISSALTSIWQQGKGAAFYKGLKWNVMSSALKGSCGWTLHNFSNRCVISFYPQKNQKKPSLPFTILVGAGVAFLETSLIVCPLERLKTVEMTSHPKQLIKVKDCIKQEGIGFFYRGWRLVLLRQSCSWISYLSIYQQLRRIFLGQEENPRLSLVQKVAMGGITGGLVATINSPLDLLKTHAQKASAVKTDSLFMTASIIFSSRGVRGLYNGLSMKICRQAWSAMTTLVVLDYLGALPENMRV